LLDVIDPASYTWGNEEYNCVSRPKTENGSTQEKEKEKICPFFI